MGNYYEDVYLKRMNIDGTTRQERIKTRKEKEFNKIFLKQSEYQVKVQAINDDKVDIVGSLQPNKWNESELVSNLLISTSARELHSGEILTVDWKIKDKENNRYWLILFEEKNLTKGYQLYKTICLDSVVSLVDEYGTTDYSFPVKFVNATSKIVQDVFIHSANQPGYREPDGTRFFITSDFDFIKKPQYFNYKERGWEIAGIDNISIENVAFVTITERLLRAPETLSSKDILVGEDKNFFLNGGA